MGEGAAEQDDKAGKAQDRREAQRRLTQWVRDFEYDKLMALVVPEE